MQAQANSERCNPATVFSESPSGAGLLTIRECMKRTGKTARQIRFAITRRYLRATRSHHGFRRELFIKKSDLEAWLRTLDENDGRLGRDLY